MPRVLHHPDTAYLGKPAELQETSPAPCPRPKPSLSGAMAAVDRTRGGALELQAEQGMKLLKATDLRGPIWEAL